VAGYQEDAVKIVLALLGLRFLTAGCAPIEMAIPLADPGGWMQLLSDSEANGVPVLSMAW
jgi:hypothetical protein